MKYRNQKTVANGRTYDSKKEAKDAFYLRMRERAGEISDLQEQVTFKIEHNGVKICKYIADFTFMENGKLVVKDTKSEFTKKLPVYRLKKKLLLAFHNITILD
jgi:hypothetical protein